MDTQLNNAIGAFKVITDYRTGLDADLLPVPGYRELLPECVATAAIAVGDLVIRTVPTATVPMRYTKGGTALGAFLVAGVALTAAAAAGNRFDVCRVGFCRVNVGAGTPVIGDMGVIGATPGQVDVVAAATGITAATFAGNVLGTFLGTKDASNLAFFWYERV